MWSLFKIYSSQALDAARQFIMHVEGAKETQGTQLIRAIWELREDVALRLINDMQAEALKDTMSSRNGLYWADKDTRGLDLVVGLGLLKVLETLYHRIPELMHTLNSDLDTILHIAIGTNQPELAELILAHNPELIGIIDHDGLTPLQSAAVKGYDRVVKILLPKMHPEQIAKKFEGNDELRPFNGKNALHLATMFDYLEVVKLLVDHAPYLVNSRTTSERTPLYISIMHGRADIAQVFIDKMHHDELINEINNNDTALTLALTQLKIGIDSTDPNNIDRNIAAAKKCGIYFKHDPKQIQNFIDAQNSIINQILEKVDTYIIEQVGKEFYLELHCAVIYSDERLSIDNRPSFKELAPKLLKHNPQVINGLSKYNPFLIRKALSTLNKEQLYTLIEVINLEDINQIGNKTVLHFAVAQNHIAVEVIEALCAKASDTLLNSIDSEGKNLLHIIAEIGYGYRFMREYVGEASEDNDNFISTAVTIKIMHVLLNYLSTDTIEAVDNNYQTALHKAALRNCYQMCELLSSRMSFNAIYLQDYEWNYAIDLTTDPQIKENLLIPIKALAKYLVVKFSKDAPIINYDHYSVFKFYQIVITDFQDEFYDIVEKTHKEVSIDKLIEKVDYYYAKNFFTITGVCKQMQKLDEASDIPILPPDCLAHIAYFVIYPAASEYIYEFSQNNICEVPPLGEY